MSGSSTKYKTIQHFHEPGDFHELTFSCYRRLPLLTNDTWQQKLAEALDRALENWQFRLHAFVFMPEHVHLLVYPAAEPAISSLLQGIKKPFSFRIKQLLQEMKSPLLGKLTIRERPGKQAFRFWQEGPGYDRNLQTPEAVLASIAYIHNNQIKRGLCDKITDWKWSSARFYATDIPVSEPNLPRLTKLPAEFLA